MTLPKLLFALNQKSVVLSAGKRERIRFNPRGPVSPAIKQAIQEHKAAILALLRGEDLDDWRMARILPPNCEEPADADDDPAQRFDPSDPSEWTDNRLEAMRLAQLESENESRA